MWGIVVIAIKRGRVRNLLSNQIHSLIQIKPCENQQFHIATHELFYWYQQT